MGLAKKAVKVLFIILPFVFVSLFFISGSQAQMPYPDKGIIIFNFDDTYKSAYTKAYPMLKEKGWKGTVYICPTVVGWSVKMTVEEMEELNAEGWDVSSHGWSHLRPSTLSPAELTKHLKDSHDWLVDHGFIKGARHYAPPNGDCNWDVYYEAIKYYQTIRLPPAYRGGYCLLLPPGYEGNLIAVHDAIAWDKVKEEIDSLTSNQILFLGFHDIVDANPYSNRTSLARLSQIIDYVAEKELNVLTLSDLLDGVTPTPTPTPTETPTPSPTPTPTPTPILTPTPTPIPPEEIIIDNQDGAFSVVGWWGTYRTTGGYGEDIRYTGKKSSRQSTKSATWSLNIPISGNYQVYAMWLAHSSLSGDVGYQIYYNGQTETVLANQTQNGDTWNLLGTYFFDSQRTDQKIMITNEFSTGQRVCADAIRLVPSF